VGHPPPEGRAAQELRGTVYGMTAGRRESWLSPLVTGGETRGGFETSTVPPSWQDAAWDGPKRSRFLLPALSTTNGGTPIEMSGGVYHKPSERQQEGARIPLLGVSLPAPRGGENHEPTPYYVARRQWPANRTDAQACTAWASWADTVTGGRPPSPRTGRGRSCGTGRPCPSPAPP